MIQKGVCALLCYITTGLFCMILADVFYFITQGTGTPEPVVWKIGIVALLGGVWGWNNSEAKPSHLD